MALAASVPGRRRHCRIHSVSDGSFPVGALFRENNRAAFHLALVQGVIRLFDLVEPEVLDAIRAHTGSIPCTTALAKALYCADPVTGFLVACALVRPEKKLEPLKLKSVKKRWRSRSFAAGASREQMDTCSELGLSRDEFLALSLEAMKAVAAQIGL